MRHYCFLFAVLCFLFESQCHSFAQVDIKSLDNKGKDYIESLLGPCITCELEDYDGSWIRLKYDRCEIGISNEDKRLEWLTVWDDSIKVLSSEGGIRVGDCIDVLTQIDFVKTRYGRGKTKNALTLIKGKPPVRHVLRFCTI